MNAENRVRAIAPATAGPCAGGAMTGSYKVRSPPDSVPPVPAPAGTCRDQPEREQGGRGLVWNRAVAASHGPTSTGRGGGQSLAPC